MTDGDCVKVALRVRPLVSSEREKGCSSSIERTPGYPQVSVGNGNVFTFNFVFDEHNTQEEVYKDAVYDMLDKLFTGYNITILAYGQTGSGKTHTMGTAFDGNLNENTGVIPRAMNDIFHRMEEKRDELDFTVTCSFMELYNEQLFDLLSTKPRDQSIVEMRESRHGIVMPGLTELPVRSALETTNCLMRGSSGRAVASTAMNKESSRSHAIFTVTMQAAEKIGTKSVTTSKFHLVDLAGSERSKKTQATGDRFKEGININQGLLALGNVISALGANQGGGFVSYRDSKLTRLLQDSLGGNSVTLMIACVSPADYNIPETLSTLRYADRARKIKNKPIINQDPHAAEINHLKAIIQKLRLELMACGGGMTASLSNSLHSLGALTVSSSSVANNVDAVELCTSNTSYLQLQEKVRSLQQKLQSTLHDVAENEMRAHIVETAHEKLKGQAEAMKAVVAELSIKKCTDCAPEMDNLREIVINIESELEKTQTEIAEQKRASQIDNNEVEHNAGDSLSSSETPEMSEILQQRSEAYTCKQINFTEELRRINRQLNLKEELHQIVAGNLNKFDALDENAAAKIQECNQKIQELELERNELVDKLKHVKDNISAKLAEERRKRVQVLEQEISSLKTKNVQQSKIVKMREKDAEKMKNLCKEIQSMKESKVKLIKAMRLESENFRRWKAEREKEVIQLKSRDRKMQTEMAKKDALHEKQRSVLKRKCEEAHAVNKRLKEALDRQKVAQSMRQKQQANKGNNISAHKIESAITWLDQELEVLTSLVEAGLSLKQLKEDRCEIVSSIRQLLEKNPQKNTQDARQLKKLRADLDVCECQISELEQKVDCKDHETRRNELGESIQTLPEARAVILHLFNYIFGLIREHTVKVQELKASLENIEEQSVSTEKCLQEKTQQCELKIAELQNSYEEKIAVLLRELQKVPQVAEGNVLTPEQQEVLRIREESLNQLDDLREQLARERELVAQLRASRKTNNQKNSEANACKFVPIAEEDLEEIFDSDDDEIDRDDKDPDWIKTPLVKSRRKRITGSGLSASNVDETLGPIKSESTNTSTTEPVRKRVKHMCKCTGKCITKRCGCHSRFEQCSQSCRCTEKCQNGKSLYIDEDTIEEETSVDKENKSDSLIVPETPEKNITNSPAANIELTKTITAGDANLLTPRNDRLTKNFMAFESFSAKKKFFQ